MDPSQPSWTFEENKFFEKVMAEVDRASPFLYQDIARKMPWRSVEEIHKHYGLLIRGLNSVNLGNYPPPIYDSGKAHENLDEVSSKPRKYTQWTQQEHQLFLMGLEQYGKGDWKSISMQCVRTKTSTQVASHAQKYFKRLNNPTSTSRRRYSIHDSVIDPNFFPLAGTVESQMQRDDSQMIENQNPITNTLELFPNPISYPSELPPNPNPN